MIPLFKVHMPDAVDAPLLSVLHSGYITQGQKVEEFEAAFAKFSGFEHVVSVNSGTSALTLALRLAGVEAGDQVITTPMTCSATNLPILSLGAIPVFSDITQDGLIDPSYVERLITEDTKAIMAVDWGGMPVDVARLQDIADRHEIKLIVDAAHGMGTVHNGEADFFCYSLQAIKHITTVDGGLLICKDKRDARDAKKLRWFGIDRSANSLDSRIDEDIEDWGYKFHMNDVAATIGIVQLQYAGDVIHKHRVNAAYYDMHLSHYFKRSAFNPASAYWLYTVLLPSTKERDIFKKYMHHYGIQTSEVHRRNDRYSVFAPYASRYEPTAGIDIPMDYPRLDDFSGRQVSIPVHWNLSDEELKYIVSTANAFVESRQ